MRPIGTKIAENGTFQHATSKGLPKYEKNILLIILATAVMNAPAIDTKQLASNIVNCLTKDCPQFTKSEIKNSSEYIAGKCSSATSDTTLENDLVTVFQSSSTNAELKWMNYDQNSILLTAAASDIAIAEFPTISANEVSAAIVQCLTNYAQFKPADVESNSDYVASKCDPSSPDNLQRSLNTLFASDDPKLTWLDFSQNQVLLSGAAAKITALAFNISNYNPPPLTPAESAGTNDVWGQISLWTGAKLMNPYTIGVQPGQTYGTLQTASSSAVGYIEINLNTRYVLRNGTDNNEPFIPWPWGQSDQAGVNYEDGKVHFFPWPLAQMPDIEARFGYLFSSGTAPTNYNASTIVGSSDIYADTELGFPIARFSNLSHTFKSQLTIEGAGGFTTDREHLELHPTAFVGLGWSGNFTRNFGSISPTNSAYWVGRVGYANQSLAPCIAAGNEF